VIPSVQPVGKGVDDEPGDVLEDDEDLEEVVVMMEDELKEEVDEILDKLEVVIVDVVIDVVDLDEVLLVLEHELYGLIPRLEQ